tara:strand:- start:760 stop:1449 length:690 start_codon:yes stop_codon:yes gene_type:complete
VKKILSLLHLVYPEQCLVCDKEISIQEKHLCSFCTQNISHTNFHLLEEASSMDKLFWGRVKVENTYAHIFFEKNKTSQDILFSLKYKNNSDIGVFFGKQIGETLKTQELYSTIDAVIPIPLHPKKQFIRGYNQSEALAKGICSSFLKRLDINTVKRTRHSESQTKKSRFQRWDNVNDIFKIKRTIENYKHILLVDDVITTGSTLESIIVALRKRNPELQISVATLAIAK